MVFSKASQCNRYSNILVFILFLQITSFIPYAYSVKKDRVSLPSLTVPTVVSTPASEVFSVYFYSDGVGAIDLQNLYSELVRNGRLLFGNARSTIYELNEAHLILHFPGHRPDKEYLLKYSREPEYRSIHVELASANYQEALRADLIRKRDIYRRIPNHRFLMKVLAKEWRVEGDALEQFELFEKVKPLAGLSPIQKSERLVEAIKALLDAGLIHGDLKERNFVNGVLIDLDIMYLVSDQASQKQLADISFHLPYLKKLLELREKNPSKIHQINMAFEMKQILTQWLPSKEWALVRHAIFLEIINFARLNPSWRYFMSGSVLPLIVQRKIRFGRINMIRNGGMERRISTSKVPGDGDCLFHSLVLLTGNRSINRREFVRRLLAKNNELMAMSEAGIPLSQQDQIIQSVIEGIIMHSPQHISQQANLEVWAEYFLSPFDLEYPMADHPVVQAVAILFDLNIAAQHIDLSGGEPAFVPYQTFNSNGEAIANPASPTYYIGYVPYHSSGDIPIEGEPNHFIPISLGAPPPIVLPSLPSAAPSVPLFAHAFVLLPALSLAINTLKL